MLKYLRMGNKRIKIVWWTLIVITIVTFVFLFGAGFGSGPQNQVAGALGSVNGQPITQDELRNAISEQRLQYQQRTQTEPGEQESRMLEAQAWRAVVTQALLEQQARKLGLKPTDREVVITLQSSPPQVLLMHPEFQTNGQFDPNKYAAAMRNPNVNWAPYEQLVRDQLPIRKLQERLLTSLKLSQPELEDAFKRRFEKLAMTLAMVPAAVDAQVPAPGEADLDRVYKKYKGRFNAPARLNLEVLAVPLKIGEEELRAARETATSLVTRARAGEDFAQLAKDYSEGPGAAQGGEINRAFQPAEFGPDLEPRINAMKDGDISDPIPQTGGFLIIKLLQRVPDPMSPVPSLRVAQIIVRARPSEASVTEQLETVTQVRNRARSVGLAKAATEKGLQTAKTSYFAFGNTPPQLFDAPTIADWAFGAKVNEVSGVVRGSEAVYVAQVAEVREAGPAPKADIMDQLRALAEAEARVKVAKPKADQIAQALAAGSSLEQAAAAAGITPTKVAGMTREGGDPNLASSPEAVGRAFALPVGKVAGPLETPAGWVFMRVDAKLPADTTAFEQIKGQITNDILQRRQQEFLQAWVTDTRRGAKIKDMRAGQ